MYSYFAVLNFLIRTWALGLTISFLLIGVRSDPAKIQDGLFASTHDKRNILVHFGETEEMENIAYQVHSEYGHDYPRTEKIYALYTAFSDYAKKCQESAQSYLESGGYKYKAMWATNTIVVKRADSQCAQTLAKLQDVATISEDRNFPLLDPIEPADTQLVERSPVPEPFRVGMTWGLSKMYVKKAWEYGSYYGELKQGGGIVVGHIDTGVRYTHEALRDNWRQYDGWADGYNLSHTPVDENGHGTHTLGTIVGQYRIGVAPSAQWISCRGCHQRDCRDSALLFCCEWMLCPHDLSEGPNSYKHCYPPDLVSNSWGGGQGDSTYERCIFALHSAGIIPIWANGNSGPQCSTANSPGDSPFVIGVGATNKDDELASFCSRGPPVVGLYKPDVSAPGVEVKSAWIGNDTDYKSISGTSMATPHVAGLVALILERCKLPYHTVLDILQSTADRQDLGISEMMCGDTRSDVFPNNFYGWGRVNAFSAIQKAVAICYHNNHYYNEGYQGHLSYSFGNKLGGFTSRYTGVPYFNNNNAHNVYDAVKQ